MLVFSYWFDMGISHLLTYDMAIRCLVKVFRDECYYQSWTDTITLYIKCVELF